MFEGEKKKHRNAFIFRLTNIFLQTLGNLRPFAGAIKIKMKNPLFLSSSKEYHISYASHFLKKTCENSHQHQELLSKLLVAIISRFVPRFITAVC